MGVVSEGVGKAVPGRPAQATTMSRADAEGEVAMADLKAARREG